MNVTGVFARPLQLAPSGLAGQVRFATKKAGGSTSNGRSSLPKHLGVKSGNGMRVVPGTIIVRQRGTSWHAGPGVGIGRDHTLHALIEGRVVFRYDLKTQRRIICVSDESGAEAPLVGYASRTETKKRLADAVDAQHYLSLDSVGRYQYVLGLAKKLSEEEDVRKRELLEKRLTIYLVDSEDPDVSTTTTSSSNDDFIYNISIPQISSSESSSVELISLQDDDSILRHIRSASQTIEQMDVQGTDESSLWASTMADGPTLRRDKMEILSLCESGAFWLVEYNDKTDKLSLVQPEGNHTLKNKILATGYRCISHYWGPGVVPWDNHTVDGITWDVPMRIEKRSRILSVLKERPGFVWIDVFCIRQNIARTSSNLTASATVPQISIMGKVYRYCDECIALLDVPDAAILQFSENLDAFTPMLRFLSLRTRENSDESLIGHIVHLSSGQEHPGSNADDEFLARFEALAVSLPHGADWGELLIISAERHRVNSDFARALVEIMGSQWFCRVWTIQEAVLPSSVVIRSESLNSAKAQLCTIPLQTIIRICQGIYLWTTPVIATVTAASNGASRRNHAVDQISRIQSLFLQLQSVAKDIILIAKLEECLTSTQENIVETVLGALANSKRTCSMHQDYFYGVCGLIGVSIEAGLAREEALIQFLSGLQVLGIPIASVTIGSEKHETDSWVGISNWDTMAAVYGRWRKLNTSIRLRGFALTFNQDEQPTIRGERVILQPTQKLRILRKIETVPDPDLLSHCRAMVYGQRINTILGRRVINIRKCRESLQAHVSGSTDPLVAFAQEKSQSTGIPSEPSGELENNGSLQLVPTISSTISDAFFHKEFPPNWHVQSNSRDSYLDSVYTKFATDILSSLDKDGQIVSYEIELLSASSHVAHTQQPNPHPQAPSQTQPSVTFTVEECLLPRLLVYLLDPRYTSYETFGTDLPFDLHAGMEFVHMRDTRKKAHKSGILVCQDAFEFPLGHDLTFALGTAEAANSRTSSAAEFILRSSSEELGMSVAAVIHEDEDKATIVGALLMQLKSDAGRIEGPRADLEETFDILRKSASA
ncbi:hypothetical protein HDU81_002223 [Chytriomyces hyalinus]|nr:hypothetical protein HDU81_002223 [Chytriomyces hyalinus]